MFDKAIARQPERAAPAQFSQLQGHAVSIKPAPTQDVWFMESDLPDLIDQSPFGPDPGHGAFAASGLAQHAHAAALHIRAVVLVHSLAGSGERVTYIRFWNTGLKLQDCTCSCSL